jgi:hypothetical protein
MSKEAMKLALGKIKSARDCHPNAVNTLLFEAEEILEESLEKPDFWEGYVPEPVKPAHQCKWPTCQSEEYQQALAEQIKRELVGEQPAQQGPKIDIYRSFEQWKCGNVLEHGVPRTEHYSEAQLDLVEMGWNYGYDAGRAVEQALDKKAENARELGLDYEPAQQEFVSPGGGYVPAIPVQQRPIKTFHGGKAWPVQEPAQQEPWPEEPAGHKAGGVQLSGTSKSKAITELYALFGAPHNADINLTGLNMLLDALIASPPPQRTWVGLVWGELPEDGHDHDFLRGAVWAEAKLKEKNT